MKDDNALILELGHRGSRVVDLQRRLIDVGYNLVPDGVFGKKTFEAVIDFQRNNSLKVDGVVGQMTSRAIAEKTGKAVDIPVNPARPKLPIKVNNSKKSVDEILGDFRGHAWDSTYTTPVILPGAAFHDGRDRKCYAHIYMADALQSAMAEMVRQGLKFFSYDGCGNKRLMRGSKSKWSVHSWSAAIDFDQALNPLGAEPKMDIRIVEIFEKCGFVWGGSWKKKDGMHFQIIRNY